MKYLDEEMIIDLSWHGIDVVINTEQAHPFSLQVSRMTLDGYGTIGYMGKTNNFYFEEKTSLSHNNANRLIELSNDLKEPLCIVSDQLSANVRRFLKENRVSYLCQNHTYNIMCKEFMIYIDPYVRFPRFKEFGIKKLTQSQLVFLLNFLIDQSIIQMTNAKIAKQIGLSEGAVSNAINYFVKENLISKSGKKRTVNQIPKQFDELIKKFDKLSNRQIIERQMKDTGKDVQKNWFIYQQKKRK